MSPIVFTTTSLNAFLARYDSAGEEELQNGIRNLNNMRKQ